MFKNKTIVTVIGFLMAGIGLLAIFLSIVNVNFSFLYWMQSFGSGTAFAMKIGLAVIGFIMIYIGRTDWEQEEIL